jgi:hypothetical protein
MTEALLPRYPVSRRGIDIDMTRIPGMDDNVYWQSKKKEISILISRSLAAGGAEEEIGHLSVFALGPMPLLMHLGNCLSNKIATDLFQRHRDTEKWVWRENSEVVDFTFTKIKEGADSEVVLVLSLSGKVGVESLRGSFSSDASIYEITLKNRNPSPTFLEAKETLENFKTVYRDAISEITAQLKGVEKIHLFPAVPAPIAILCGRELLHKVDPVLAVYDFNKENGFKFAMEVNSGRE